MMNLILEWIVAIHYNAYITLWEFVRMQIPILVAIIAWLWQAKMIYEEKERLARPRRRPL